jgi:peptidoglycan/xylan/chitin deacetylase (PgdA/CDA1 family)
MAENRKVILSFDDGPRPEKALKSILTVLQGNGIKAEFYLLGSEVESNPSATKLITSQGHKAQNHSWSHPNLAKVSEDRVRSELQKTQQIIKDATGIKPTKVRPPYGAGGWPKKYDPELAKVAQSLSLIIQNWDIDTEDWKSPRGIGPTKIGMIKQQLERNTSKPTINVLMHVQQETARDLPEFISFLKELGFTLIDPVN